MSVALRIPEVGESITEVHIGDWLKTRGDTASLDEGVVVIETDKVTVELPAPVAGTITEILKSTGESAEVGEIVAYMEEGVVASTPQEPAPEAKSAAAPQASPAASPVGRAGPAARRALELAGLDAAGVTPTGPGARVSKTDVAAAIASAVAQPSAPAEPQPPRVRTTPRPAAARAGGGSGGGGAREEELVPMSPLRLRVAERLVQAQRNAALLTTFNEIDMTTVKRLRAERQEEFLARHGVKLGFMSFFMRAAIEALKLVPAVNAEIRGTDILYRNYFDIGVAVGGGKGLVVPVIRNAEQLGFAEIELAIADLATRARANKLSLDELQGGTFTISNGGIYGSLLSTPIVNPPQSGILGLHAIQDRPVVVGGEVVARPMMYVALSYDHRMIDGREAVTFLKHVKHCVEEPARMLLEV